MGSRRAISRALTCVLAACWLFTLAAPALAGSGGTITVRLVLRGDVPATDSFGLGGSTRSGIVGIEPVYCGPQPNSASDTPPCAAASFEFAFDFEVGDTFDFTVYRCKAGVCDQAVYEATAKVTSSPQTYTVLYDYSLAAAPLLPDTATPQRSPMGETTAFAALVAGAASALAAVWCVAAMASSMRARAARRGAGRP